MKRGLLFKLTAILTISLAITGCGIGGGKDSAKGRSEPRTSTLENRRKVVDEEVREAREITERDAIVIKVMLRPKFVLHIDKDGRIYSVEGLNDEGDEFLDATKSIWRSRLYSEAIPELMEEAIVKGYISDNNPNVNLEEMGLDTEYIAKLRSSIEDVLKIHNITAELEIAERKTDR